MTRAPALVILAADDYAMTDGVSRAIEELAERRLLSAAGAMTTSSHWPRHAPRLAGLRDRIAVGLHLNLTLGAPLGDMSVLAPDGHLPPIGHLARAALLGRTPLAEIDRETTRQLVAFEDGLGHPPDYIDGHQHAHALPGVRQAVLAAISRRGYAHTLLIRDPADSLARLLRAGQPAKSLVLAALAAGFGRRARAAGYVVNDTFGGITDFAPDKAAADLAASLALPGQLHIAMCHPGFVDDELAAIDPVTVRRRREYDALLAAAGLAERLWHPVRAAGGPPIDWRAIRGDRS